MEKQVKNPSPNSLTPGQLELIKFRQENPVFFKNHIEGLASSTGQVGVDYKAMGYDDAAKGYKSSWWKPYDQDRSKWSEWNIPDDMAEKAFQQQSFGEIVGDMVVGFGKGFGAGFMGAIGSLDVANMTALAMDKTDVEYSNWATRLADKINANIAEENKIYQDPSGSIWNMAYLGNGIQQTGYSAGIVGEMVLEQIALAALTGGSGNAVGLASKARLLTGLGKQAGMGMLQGIKEANMNALETGNSTYQKFKDLGFSDEEATKKSREAANLHFKTEALALVGMNVLQNMVFLGSLGKVTNKAFSAEKGLSFGISDAIESGGKNVFGALTKKIGNESVRKAADKTLGTAFLMGSEAIEEGVQTGIGTYSERAVQGKDTSWGDLWEGHEMRDSMFLGGMGGLFLGAGFKAIEKFNNRKFDKDYKNIFENSTNIISNAIKAESVTGEILKKTEQEFLNMKKDPTKNAKEVGAMEQALNDAKYEHKVAQQKLINAGVQMSLKADYAKKSGNTTIFNMSIEHLENVQEAIKNKDVEALQNAGILKEDGTEFREGLLEDLIVSLPERIKDANVMKGLYEQELNNTTSDFDSATNIVQNKFQIYKNGQTIGELHKKGTEYLSEIEKLSGISKEGLNITKLRAEKRAIEGNERVANSEYGKQRLSEINEILEDNNTLSSEDTSKLRRAGYFLNSGDSTLQKLYALTSEYEAINEKLANQAMEASNPETIRKNIIERRKKDIKKAKKIEEVEQIQEEAKEDPVAPLTKDEEKAIEEKKTEIAVEEKKTEVDKEAKVTTVVDTEKNPVIQPTKMNTREEAKNILDEIAEDGNTDFRPSDATLDDFDMFGSKYSGNTSLDNFLNNLNRHYDRMEGRDATYEDIIHEFASLAGLNNVKKKFNNLTNLLKSKGVDTSNSTQVFNNLFKSAEKILGDIPVDEVEQRNEEIVELAHQQTDVKDNSEIEELSQEEIFENKEEENEGSIEFQTIEENRKTNKSDLKAAHSHQYKMLIDGKWWVVEDFLKEDPFIDNKYILDPNYTAGLVRDEVELELREVDDDNFPLTYVNENEEVIATTWGQYKKNIPQDKRYLTVPIIAYHGDTPIFTIHNHLWYNKFNVQANPLQTQDEVIEEGQRRVIETREQLKNGNNKIVLTKVGVGNVDNMLKHVNGTFKSLSESSDPNSILAVYTQKAADDVQWRVDSLKTLNKELGDAIVLGNNLKEREQGTVLELRKVGKDAVSGKDIYVALEVSNDSPNSPNPNFQKDLNDTSYNSIKWATIASLLLNNKTNEKLQQLIKENFNFTLHEAEELQKQILNSSSKINIQNDLKNYLDLFLPEMDLYKRDKNKEKNLTVFEGWKSGSLSGVTFFNGDTKTNVIGKINDGFENTILKDLNNFFSENGQNLLRKTKFSVRLNSMNFNFPVVNSEGRVLDNTPMTFKQLYRDNLKTNIKSHEITGANGEKQFITDIQPMVYYRLATAKASPSVTDVSSSEIDINDQIDNEIQNLDVNIQQQIQEILEAGISEEEVRQMIAQGAFGNIENIDDLFGSRLTYDEEVGEKFDALETNLITGISRSENNKLVNSLFNLAIEKIDFTKTISLEEVKKALYDSIEDNIQSNIKTLEKRIENLSKLRGMESIIENQTLLKNKLENILNEQEKLFGTEEQPGSLIQLANKFFSVDFNEIELLDENINSSEQQSTEIQEGVQERAYDTQAYEESMFKKLKTELKLYFLGLHKEQINTSQKQYNSLGLLEYNDLQESLERLKEVTTSSKSDLNVILDNLEKRYTETGNSIYKQIRTKILNAPTHIQNQILYTFIQNPAYFHSTMISNKTSNVGNKVVVTDVTTTIIDENSDTDLISRKEELHKDFIHNSLINMGYVESNENGEKILNKELSLKRLQELAIFLDKVNEENYIPSFEEVKEMFNNYGLGRISDNVIKDLMGDPKKNFFGKGQIFSFIQKQLQHIIDEETEAVSKGERLNMELKENSILAGASSQLNKLLKLDIEKNGTLRSPVVRAGDKMLQSSTNSTMIYDILTELKDELSDKSLLLRGSVLSKNNFVMNLLQNHPGFRDNTNLSWFSPRAIKLHGRDNNAESDIVSLGALDYFSTIFANYANRRGLSKIDAANQIPGLAGLNFRYAKMTPTTFADKGNLMLWNTAVLDLNESQMYFDEEGNIQFTPVLADFLFNQLFLPEFNRIVESFKIQMEDSNTNIIGFDKASKFFINFPLFNEVTISTSQGDKLISEVLFNKDKNELGIIDPEQYRESVINLLQDWFTYSTNNKLSQDGKSGSFVENGIVKIDPLVSEDKNGILTKEAPFVNISTSFINSKPGESSTDKMRYALAEFEINTLLNQNNIYTLFLGDQAFYSKDRYIDGIETGKYTPQEASELISLIIDKRAAMLIAPGGKLAHSDSNEQTKISLVEGRDLSHYHQIFVNDREDMTDYIDAYIEAQYGRVTKEQQDFIDKIREVNSELSKAYEQFETEINPETLVQLDEKIVKLKEEKNLLINGDKETKGLKHTAPELAGYFEINGTDAQEYSTWRTHLDILFRKGDLTEEERDKVKSAYEKLSKGEYEDITKDEYSVIMQPLKTVYTNLVEYVHPITGVKMARPVYIKSSTIPLLPHVTVNNKIDEVRKKLEAIEEDKDTTVKMSYQSANKIGATNVSLTMDDFYHRSFESLYSEEGGLLQDAILKLPMAGMRIQQETPYHQGHAFSNKEDSYISMGSQFMKIILGNGVNKMGDVFTTDNFTVDLLERVGLDTSSRKLNGQNLEKIYNHVYKEYSDLLKDILFEEFDIDPNTNFESLTSEKQFEILQNIAKILQKEITTKNYPQYMLDSLKIVEDILASGNITNFNLPLLLDSNSNKFETLLQAIVSNRLISHKLPGNGHISASSEGFSQKKTLESLTDAEKQGITYIHPNNTDLSPTYFTTKKGKKILKKARVLIPSHYAYWKEMEDGRKEYVEIDWTSEEYSTPIKNEKGEIIGRQINTAKIDPKLLEMFSFRIPTSSHQSGVILEVAGFLPKEMGDTIVVPKENTTQLGEDYDIDKRYVYKNNYYVSKDGYIGKVKYTNKNKNKESKLKALESTLVDIYKTVYSSDNVEVQKKIFKPLVTDVADNTANIISEIQNSDIEAKRYFTNMSSDYQYYLIKLGADGKNGIGVHSNAVTFQAQLDRITDENKLFIKDEFGNPVSYRFGKEGDSSTIVSNGILGATNEDKGKAINSEYDVADQHGENQNVSTDNINKQIMIKRNENAFTMSVYAMFGFRKIYTTDVVYKNKKQTVSYPSLFISQPVLTEYVKLMSKYDSTTIDYKSRQKINNEIISQLAEKFDFQNFLEFDKNGNIDLQKLLSPSNMERSRDFMGGQEILNSLDYEQALKNPLQQIGILQQFLLLKSEAETIQKINSLLNLSSSKLGISNFNNIQKVNLLNDIAYTESGYETDNNFSNMGNISNLIGEYKLIEDNLGSIEDLKAEGFIPIGKYLWKPTTIEGTMLINSLHAANNIVDIVYPYTKPFINNTVEKIFRNNSKNPNLKSVENLKWKYEIVSSMRDFLYTLTNSKMYNDLVGDTKRLFLEDENNTSLAGIIDSLRISKNDIIINNSLIRDFKLTVRKDGYPSLIQHFSSATELLDVMVKNEGFRDLLADNTTILGEFNGEQYTPRMLAQDLVAYSYLSDVQKGASSFRNNIDYNYLEYMGITKGLRKTYNYLMSLDNVAAESFIENFTKQYFQHNPNRASILSSDSYFPSDFENLDSEMTKEEFNVWLNKVENFTLKPKEDSKGLIKDTPQYIAIRKPSFRTEAKNKKFRLFEKGPGGVYSEIPILGDLGMNEYNANLKASQTKSSVLDRKAPVVKQVPQQNYNKQQQKKDLNNKLITKDARFSSVTNIVNSLVNTEFLQKHNPELVRLLKDLQGVVDDSVSIVFEIPKSVSIAEYDSIMDVIRIHPSIWEILYNKNIGREDNLTKTSADLVEVLAEEILHSNTISEIKKWGVDPNAKKSEFILREDAPENIKRLYSLYEEASSKDPYNPNDIDSYHSKDFFEFVAGMYSSPEYRERVEAKNKGFIAKFLDTIRNIFRSLYSEKTGQNLTYKDVMFNDIRTLLRNDIARRKGVEPKALPQSNTMKDFYDMISNTPSVSNNVTQPNLVNSQNNTPYYEGDIVPEPNTIFVFGSNPEGRHGAGAAKVAKDKFGAIYGQGEGLQGNAYALPTKDLRIKENNGYKSILPNQIIQSIKKLYEVAKQNPTKKFKVAYRNTTTTSLNGYTGLEMIEMFKQAGPIPSNIIFSKEWYDVMNNIIPVANIPQNLTSGQEAFGTLQHATPEVKAILGENPTSIDMIEAGLRTRTTRSVGEMEKYNIKVGDVIKHFGKSADGKIKNIKARVTAIHYKGTPEFESTWYKEGWTQEGVKAIQRYKDGAAAIEFEVIKNETYGSKLSSSDKFTNFAEEAFKCK